MVPTISNNACRVELAYFRKLEPEFFRVFGEGSFTTSMEDSVGILVDQCSAALDLAIDGLFESKLFL